MLAAFGQAMLLVAPHLTGEGALTDGVHTQLLLPLVANASLAMAHHSPTRLTSQLRPCAPCLTGAAGEGCCASVCCC